MSVPGLTAYFKLEQVLDGSNTSEKLSFNLYPKKSLDGDAIFTFGRGNNCDFRFDSPDLPYLISRQHAKVILSGKDAFLTDLESVNGTYVNDIMLLPNEKTKIASGDMITFGCLSLDDAVSPGKVVKQDNPPFKFLLQKIGTSETENMCHDSRKLKDICDQDSGISNGSPSPSTSSNCENLQESSRWENDGVTEEETVPLTVKNLIAFSGCCFKDLQFSSDEKENQNGRRKSTGSVPSKAKTKVTRKRRRTTTFSRKKRRKDDEESCAFYECKVKKNISRGSSNMISWVQCDNCNKWYHTDCIGCDYNSVRSTKRKFNCGLC